MLCRDVQVFEGSQSGKILKKKSSHSPEVLKIINLESKNNVFRSILDPRNEVLYTTISETLKFFNLWQVVSSLPKELDEPLDSLSLPNRQLICLVRCCIRMQSVNF